MIFNNEHAFKKSSTSRDTYKNINIDKSYQPLMELLWYSQLPCFDVVNVTTKMNEEFGNLIVQSTFLKSSLHSNLALELKE